MSLTDTVRTNQWYLCFHIHQCTIFFMHAYTRVYISNSYLPLSLSFSLSLLVCVLISTEEIEMCHFERITSHLDYYCIEDGNRFLYAYPIPTRNVGAIQCAGILCSPVIVQWNALTLFFSSSLHSIRFSFFV